MRTKQTKAIFQVKSSNDLKSALQIVSAHGYKQVSAKICKEGEKDTYYVSFPCTSKPHELEKAMLEQNISCAIAMA